MEYCCCQVLSHLPLSNIISSGRESHIIINYSLDHMTMSYEWTRCAWMCGSTLRTSGGGAWPLPNGQTLCTLCPQDSLCRKDAGKKIYSYRTWKHWNSSNISFINGYESHKLTKWVTLKGFLWNDVAVKCFPHLPLSDMIHQEITHIIKIHRTICNLMNMSELLVQP